MTPLSLYWPARRHLFRRSGGPGAVRAMVTFALVAALVGVSAWQFFVR